jgi:hypothetical protein
VQGRSRGGVHGFSLVAIDGFILLGKGRWRQRRHRRRDLLVRLKRCERSCWIRLQGRPLLLLSLSLGLSLSFVDGMGDMAMIVHRRRRVIYFGQLMGAGQLRRIVVICRHRAGWAAYKCAHGTKCRGIEADRSTSRGGQRRTARLYEAE